MTGGATLLSLRGIQDKYLHYNPKHSFFTTSHITYEPFSLESIQIVATGEVNFSKTSKFDLDCGAEYIAGGAFEITLPAIANAGGDIAWIHSIGIYLIKKLSFKGQSQTYDQHYSEFIDLYTRFTISESRRHGFNDMIGEVNPFWGVINGVNENITADSRSLQFFDSAKDQTTILIPIFFWWCNDFTQALPIGVILYSGLRLEAEFRPASECYIVTQGAITATPSIVNCLLYVDGIYIDKAARNRIAKFAQFYVVKQTQFNDEVTVSDSTLVQKLGFTMPVSELVWGVREDAAVANNVRRYDWWDRYQGNSTHGVPDETMELVTIKLSSQEIEEPRGSMFYNRYLPYKYNHTCIPKSRGVYCKPFALYPEKSMASGDVNFSQSDNNIMIFNFNNNVGADGTSAAGIGATLSGGSGKVSGILYLFAINYNYIFISSGYMSKLYNG